MRDEGGRHELASQPVRVAEGHEQSVPRAGAGDVAVEAFVRELLAHAGSEPERDFELVAICFGEQHRISGRRGEHALIYTQEKDTVEIGIARAINAADQHLIERGRNHAHGQAHETRLHDGQPFPQGQALMGKAERHRLQPLLHLIPDRGVNGAVAGLLGPRLKLIAHAKGAPEFAQRAGEFETGGLPTARAHQRGLKNSQRSHGSLAQGFEPLRQRGVPGDVNWLQPGLTFPATRQRLVFQPVDFEIRHAGQPALEQAKPVLLLPAERDRAHRVAGQFGERVVRDGFATVEEERDFVACENATQDVLIRLKLPQQHRHVAKASARSDVPENFARGESDFTLRRGRAQDTNGIRSSRIVRQKRNRQRPVRFEMRQFRRGGEALDRRVPRERNGSDVRHHHRECAQAAPRRLRHHRPRRKCFPRFQRLRLAAERQRGSGAPGHQCAQQGEFLFRHFREAVEPQSAETRRRAGRLRQVIQLPRRHVEQAVGVLQLFRREPRQILAKHPGHIAQLAGQGRVGVLRRGGFQRRRADAGPLQLAEQPAELQREAGQTRAGPEQLQLLVMPRQQCAQHHHAAFVIEQTRGRLAERGEQKIGEAVKRKNVQPRVTGQGVVREQLALDLKRGLFRREEQQRRPLRRALQLCADFLQALESFSSAGGAEQEADLHRAVLSQLIHARQSNAPGRTNTG